MNKYLPEELRNLNANKARVMNNVEMAIEKKKKRHFPVIIATTLLTAALLVISLIALPTLKDEQGSVQNGQEILQVGEFDELLKKYFPENATTKTFIEMEKGDEISVYTEWLSAQYVKQLESKDAGITQSYYRIANNQIDLIEQNNSSETLTIDQLNKKSSIETIMKAPLVEDGKSGDWTLTFLNSTVGQYTNVVLFEKIEGTTKIENYYAPKFGLIQSITLENDIVVRHINMTKLTYALESGPMQFDKITNVKFEPTFGTIWYKSPDESKQVLLEGRGQLVKEEGVATILLEDIATQERTLYSLTNVPDGQVSPKEVHWIDNNRLLVIIGQAHGTVSMGGELYILHLEENILSPLIVDLNQYEEISMLWDNAKGTINYERFIYDNDNLEVSQSHTEEGEIQVIRATIQDIHAERIEYTIENGPSGQISNGTLGENRSSHALTLVNVKLNTQVELILVDGVVININSVE